MSNLPLVSAVLAVYNGEDYLKQSIDSILAQTFTDFELIIIDDGSTDSTAGIIEGYADRRIRALNQPNQGLAAALNKGIKLAGGKYIARQDHDDMAYPERFAKQVDFLEQHERCGLIGAWAEIWQEDRPSQRAHTHPTENEVLKFDLIFNNPFVHSSVMLRKSALDKVGLYSTDPDRQPPEDYELWSRIAREYDVANLPEILEIYREVPGSISRRAPNPFRDKVISLCAENLTWAADGSLVPGQAALDLACLVHGAFWRVSPEPSSEEMVRLVSEAADRMSKALGIPRRILRKRARPFKRLANFYCNKSRQPCDIVLGEKGYEEG